VKHETILYISDHAASSDSVTLELEAEGYEVVSTDSASQGAALLYIMHSVAAVVLHYQPEDRTWFKFAQSLRAIHPGVPIILLSRDPILCLPPWVDACVGTEQPLEEVASAVHSLLTGEPFEVHIADLEASDRQCMCQQCLSRQAEFPSVENLNSQPA
jgi:DNA-binding NarL/FixJ family response regulator